MSPNSSIAVLDSGLGGLTVMQKIIEKAPCEDILYFADTAHLPFGELSGDKISEVTLKNALFLEKNGAKLLVLACHTATSCAMEVLQRSLSIPVIGMLEPSLTTLLKTGKKSPRLAILGTSSTIDSTIYQTAIKKLLPQAALFPVKCPLFVPLIEAGLTSSPALKSAIEEYVLPIKDTIDTALLACTHYPMIKTALEEALGPGITLLDPANECAAAVQTQLRQVKNPSSRPVYRFIATKDPEKFFSKVKQRLLKETQNYEIILNSHGGP